MPPASFKQMRESSKRSPCWVAKCSTRTNRSHQRDPGFITEDRLLGLGVWDYQPPWVDKMSPWVSYLLSAYRGRVSGHQEGTEARRSKGPREKVLLFPEDRTTSFPQNHLSQGPRDFLDRHHVASPSAQPMFGSQGAAGPHCKVS